MEWKCNQCAKLYNRIPANKGFCSRKCYWMFRKENKMYPPSRKGTKITEAHKQAIRNWLNEHKEEWRANLIGRTPWNKGRPAPEMRGEKHPRWIGGHVKHPDKRIRKSAEYIEWRIKVFTRDNFTCQICGTRGDTLQADHIKPFAFFPELRLELSNGRTLCIACHRKTPTYASNKNIYEKKNS